MATNINVPVGTTTTIDNTTTVDGGADTTPYGAGGGVLDDPHALVGTYVVTGGTLEADSSAIQANITLNDATFNLTSGYAPNPVIDFGTGASQLVVSGASNAGSDPTFEDATILDFNVGDRIVIPGAGASSGTPTFNNKTDTLTFTLGSTTYNLAVLPGPGASNEFQFVTVNGQTGVQEVAPIGPVCFLRGTRLRTPRGPVAVEQLTIGDQVTVASGEGRPIKWIGRRTYHRAFARQNEGLLPICFRADSLGPRVPERDLYVSPKHAMFIDGLLIHAIELVNGSSIIQVTEPMSLDYFHIELDRHAIIFAEGAPTESYADCDNRNIFHNAHEYFERYGANGTQAWDFCAPLIESGPLADAARERLAAQAGLPRAGAQPARGRLLGFVDHVGRDHVSGWAMDEQTRDVPLWLNIFEDDALVAVVLADRYRPDLFAAGIGFGRHGFRVAIPQSHRDAHRRLDIRRAGDGALLPGSYSDVERAAA